MNNAACRLVGCEFPLFAFSHCRDVVAAVSRAGGFGVLGASSHTPEQLEVELDWIDRHVDGKPYGVDILIPENLKMPPGMEKPSAEQLTASIPLPHVKFTVDLLRRHGIAAESSDVLAKKLPNITPELSEQLMDVAFRHPIRLIANALGIAPPQMIERARRYGVPVAALVGAKEHALRQARAGVDLIVVQGTEAGGHCGEVTTLVLVPEVIRALKREVPNRDIPVLAAGGIMTGGQMAGCMAMGAAGAWTGTVWLATVESETSQPIRDRMIAATSRDTIRSASRTGKPSRQLRSAWHDAWHGKDSPGTLPMPQMSMLAAPSFELIDKAAERADSPARELVSYWVGQGVGLVEQIGSAGKVVQTFKEEFADALASLQAQLDD